MIAREFGEKLRSGGKRETPCNLHKPLVDLLLGVAATASLFLGACNVAPKYSKPTVQAPVAYKELKPENLPQTDGWKVAQPSDDVIHGKWWETFGDSKLNALEDQVSVSNQNVAAAAAAFVSAPALVRQARSQ
jgi:outer membrane protein TolC